MYNKEYFKHSHLGEIREIAEKDCRGAMALDRTHPKNYSVCLFAAGCLFVFLSVIVSGCPFSVCVSVSVSVCLSGCLALCLSIYLFLSVSVRLPIGQCCEEGCICGQGVRVLLQAAARVCQSGVDKTAYAIINRKLDSFSKKSS